jgi:4-hydroxy-tetrahydrodipicolinate synthase
VTPFLNNKIDFASLEKILNHQVTNDVKTVIIAGSTGEVKSLYDDEYDDLIKHALQNKGLNIIAGCNSSSTEKAVKIAIQAQKLGAHALMVTMPCYNKPTQEGIFRHFKAVHDAIDIPMMLYSVPSRTGVDFSDETIYRLADLDRVVAFKDAGGDLERPLRIISKIGDKISLLAGDDSVALGFNAQGCSGLVSVASNLVPKFISQIQTLWFDNQIQKALDLHAKLLPLYKAMFVETNPIAVKYAMSILNLCSSEVRLPLCDLKNENKILVEEVLRSFFKLT